MPSPLLLVGSRKKKEIEAVPFNVRYYCSLQLSGEVHNHVVSGGREIPPYLRLAWDCFWVLFCIILGFIHIYTHPNKCEYHIKIWSQLSTLPTKLEGVPTFEHSTSFHQ